MDQDRFFETACDDDIRSSELRKELEALPAKELALRLLGKACVERINARLENKTEE